MPNFKLGSTIVDDIKRQADVLMAIRASYSASDFPMRVDQIQRATMAPDNLADLRRLEANGVQRLPTSRFLGMSLTREDFPALKRGCAFNLELPEPIFVQQASFLYQSNDYRYVDISDPNTKPRSPQLVFARCAELADPEVSERIAIWVNEMVAVDRQRSMVKHTISTCLPHLPTVGHILACWPGLVALVQDKDWKTRFNNGPRSLKAYAPPAHLVQSHGKLIKACDMILTGAQLLDKYEPSAGSIKACPITYERLLTDKVFE